MIPIKRVGLLAGAASLTLTGFSFADTTAEATNAELKARVAELESRLAAVERSESDGWLTEQRADEIKSLVQDVLADADTRSSLLAQGMTAGYDNGAVLASADGNWLLRTNLLMQTRVMLNSASGQGPAGEDTLWGFEVTRAKFMLSGNVVSPEWFYRLDIEVAQSFQDLANQFGGGTVLGAGGLFKADTRSGLTNAYIGYDFGNGLKVIAGTMKAPLLYDDLVEAQYSQAVERALTTYIYTPGYVDGVAMDWTGDQFRVRAMWNNGMDDGLYGGGVGFPAGTPGPALVADTDFAITGRFDWLAMGTWDQFTDYTSPKGEEQGLLIGAGVHYQSGQTTAVNPIVPGVGTVDLFILTIDASWELGGGNVYASYIYTNGDPSGVGAPSISTNTLLFGGGYYLTEDWEVFGRYEYSDTTGSALGGIVAPPVGNTDVSIITFGVNKYFAGHHAKWTTDVGIAFDTVQFANGYTGWRLDAGGNDGQVLIRSQLQILF